MSNDWNVAAMSDEEILAALREPQSKRHTIQLLFEASHRGLKLT